jgi:hypothetical protein
MRRQPDAGRAGAMLLRTNKLAAFMLFVAIMMLPVLLYINYHRPDIEASPEQSRELVHEINGPPCGTAHFKCCGVEKDGKMALFFDVWESPNVFGSYRSYVYYDIQNRVVAKENTFQWIYEPSLYGLSRVPNTCLQNM